MPIGVLSSYQAMESPGTGGGGCLIAEATFSLAF